MKSLTLPTLLLLFSKLSTAADLQDEPQLLSNVSAHHLASERILSTRDLGLGSEFNILNNRAYECRAGYSECPNDTLHCCKTGQSCCSGTNYCADPGETCCSDYGTCPSGWKCCSGTGCAPTDGECCSGGYYCRAGKQCRIWKGNHVCCPSTGCVGEFDSGNDVGTVGGSEATETETETATVTSAYTTAAPTVTYLDYNYYFTTVYWTYWFYFWTSLPPYTVRTVTSTITSTHTIWSVYETDSSEASASLSSRSARYTFSPPYSATSLKSSLEPVTLSTADATPSATSISSGDNSGSGSGVTSVLGDSAASVSVSATGVMAAVLAAAIGGLAFGL